MKIRIIIILAAILTNCSNETKKSASNVVAEYLKAKSIFVVNGFETGNFQEKLDYIGLDIAESEILDDEKFPDNNILSISAFLFYNSLSKNDLDGKNSIRIKIKRNINGVKKEAKCIYKIEDLRTVSKKNVLLSQVLDSIVKQNYKYIYENFDDSLKNGIVDSSTIKKAFLNMDNKYGKLINFKIEAFRFDNMNELNTLDKEVIYLSYTVYRENLKSGAILCVRKNGDKLNILNVDM